MIQEQEEMHTKRFNKHNLYLCKLQNINNTCIGILSLAVVLNPRVKKSNWLDKWRENIQSFFFITFLYEPHPERSRDCDVIIIIKVINLPSY